MDDQDIDADRLALLGDLEILAQQAAQPPDASFADGARDAISRLYDRYKRRVYAYCLRRIRFHLPAGASIEDFVHDLFFRFVRSADKLKLANKHSMGDIDAQILSSFHQHATWQLQDLLDKHKRVREAVDVLLQDIAGRRTAMDVPGPSRDSAEVVRLKQAIQTLDDRARDVLLTSAPYVDIASGDFLLPEDVRIELCNRCGFKSANALVRYRLRKVAELRALLLSVA